MRTGKNKNAGKNKNESLVVIAKELSEHLLKLKFSLPVTHVYNPLEYAWSAHEMYLKRFGENRKTQCEALFLGMNPGPFGMAQTGIPFGEISAVRDWMGIETKIQVPKNTHPARPILGFACKKSEVSGRRLWGFAQEWCGTAEDFFSRFFVINYCPLAFMEESGKNRTPDKLPKQEQARLFEVCDDALHRSIVVLKPKWLIGVGQFAQDRLQIVKDKFLSENSELRIAKILHPSPQNPKANKGFSKEAKQELTALGLY